MSKLPRPSAVVPEATPAPRRSPAAGRRVRTQTPLFLQHGGEMGALMRATDWSQTGLGAPSKWPQSLRTILQVLLSAPQPMFLWWGPHRLQFYNDAYRASLGPDRHPRALGEPAREASADAWSAVGPHVEAAMERGESSWQHDRAVTVARDRRVAEAYWSYTYAPVLDDDGSVGGALATGQDTTARVLMARRMALLRRLAGPAGTATADEAATTRVFLETLAAENAEIAFACFYATADGRMLRREAVVADGLESLPVAIDLQAPPADVLRWPLRQAMRDREPQLVSELRSQIGELPGGRWPEPAEIAAVLPVEAPGCARPLGLLVLGASPRLDWNESYAEFLELAARQLGAALTSARARDAQSHHSADSGTDQVETRLPEKLNHEACAPLDPNPRRQRTTHDVTHVLENIADAVLVVDAEWRLTYLNAAARTAIGGARSGLDDPIGRHLWDELLPDARDAVLQRELARAMARRERVQFETYHGSLRRWFFVHAYPMDKGGLAIYALDISSRKAAEEVARASDERLRQLLSLMPAAVYTCDLDGRITFFNRRAAELWGREPTQGDDDQKFCGSFRLWLPNGSLLPHDHTPMAAAVHNGVSTRNGDVIIERPDGARVPVSVNIDPLYDGQGQRCGAINVLQDVTSLKQAEESLRESEQRLRAIFNQAAVGMAVAGLDGRFEEANRTFCGLLGYSIEELRSMHVLDLTHPDDVKSTREQLRRILSGEIASYTYEKRFLRKGGAELWSLTTVAVVTDAAGRPQRFIGVVEDITQRKCAEQALRRSEARFRGLFEQSTVGIVQTDLQGRFVLMNDRFCQLLGRTREELMRVTVRDVTHPDDWERNGPLLERCVREGTGFHLEKRYVRPDGAPVWVSNTVALVRDENGHPAFVQAVAVDIGERKAAEQRLRENEMRFRGLVNSVEGIVWECTVEPTGFRFTFVSQQAERLLGYPVEEWLNEPDFWAKHVHPEDREWAVNFCYTRTWQKVDHEFVYRIVARDGRTVWLRDIVTVVVENDQPVKLVGVMVDVTEQKRAHEALRESESILRSFYASSPLLMGVVELMPDDSDIVHVYDSPATERFFGREPGSTSGRRSSELGAPAEAIRIWVTHYRESERQRQPVRFEYSHPARNGRIWLSCVVAWIGPAPSGRTRFSYVTEDVTERRQAEEALRGSEERFRVLVSVVTDVPWTTNAAGEFVAAQPAWAAYTGQTMDEYRERGWIDALHPDDRECVREVWQPALQERKLHHLHARLWHAPTRQYRHIELRAAPLLNVDGTIREWVGTCTDVHDQREAEQALRESETRFRELTQKLPHVVWTNLPDGRVDFVNDVWLDYTGQTLEHVLSSPEAWGAALHPDDRERAGRIYVEGTRAGEGFTMEARFLCARDGSYRWFLNRSVPVRDSAGNVVKFIGTCTDIHERREAEERLRVSEERFQIAARATNDVIWDWDLVSNVASWSEGVRVLFGYASDQLSTDAAWWFENLHPDDRERVSAGLYAAIENGASVWRDEYRFRRADGTYAAVFDRGYVSRDATGKAVRMIGAMQDFSERKRAESLLAGQKGVLQLIAEDAPLVAVMEELTRVIEEQVPEVLASVLLRDEDGGHLRPVAGRKLPAAWTQLITPLKIGPSVGSCGTAAYRNEPVIVEDTMTDPLWAAFRKDAERFGLRACWSVPIRSSSGKVLGTFANYFTETRRPNDLEWKLVEILSQTAAFAIERQQAHDARRKLSALVEHSPNFIGVAGMDQRALFVNSAGRALVGLELDEVRETAMMEYFPENERERVEREIMPVLLQHGHWDGEVLFRNFKTGAVTPVMWNVFLIPDPKTREPAFFACVSTDITERKKAETAVRASEERYRSLVSIITDVPWTADPEGGFVAVQPAWAAYTGQSWEEHRGYGWANALHPDDRQNVVQTWHRARENRALFHSEGRLWHAASGTYRYFVVRATPLFDTDGAVREWVGSCTDVDDQKRAEEKLERTVAERTADLRETNEQLEAFVYSIAHDLRAPLRAMTGYSQLLVSDYAAALDETAQHLLQRIQVSSEFLDKMLLDLLAFGRTARSQLQLGPVPVQAAWDAAREQCAAQIERARAIVDCQLPLPTARAHEATLAQCLANLLSNAVKFVAPGVQPIVRFRTEDAGAVVRLWMEDNGIGIPADQHERVFRVFERLHGARYSGTGIGLSIVRKGIERMGGRIGLESHVGKGTRFWIELPKAP